MNKLIVLLNLSGSYKGGAQRRYINLFKTLQKERDDYYLLMNSSLYAACFHDGLFDSNKNIIVRKVKFEKFTSNSQHTIIVSNSKNTITHSLLRRKLGAYKYFIKQIISWTIYNVTLLRVIKEYKITLIYSVFTGGIWSWILARLLKIKLIYGYTDASVYLVSRKWIDILSSEYWPLKFASKVDFLSEDIIIAASKKKIYISKERVLITPNSFIDYSRYFPVYPKRELITFCSRLEKLKNPDLLLDVLICLKNRVQMNYDVAIIGEGNLLEGLKLKAERNDLKNVRFYGGLSNPEDVIATSKIFISIQSDNNYPSQSLIEAMACENAIIASDVGETRKLVTENEGMLINLDKESLAEAIMELINSPEKCKQMGESARKKVLREQTLDNFMNYFINITN